MTTQAAKTTDLFAATPEDIAAIINDCSGEFSVLESLPTADKIAAINQIRKRLSVYSPFKDEPVDCVQWIPIDSVIANDYNPNSVAPPEMKLLERSIDADGYTQPIVAWAVKDGFEVVDGFHRNRVARECPQINQRVHGHLPIAAINTKTSARNERIASTIRHNRARGKHKVEAMSDIVVELKRRNWSDTRICNELGMEQDEVLRLCQITGLSELFSDQDFSKAWDVEGEVTELDYQELSDDVSTYGEETQGFRTVNTSDDSRIFHTHDKWECHKAGFYANSFEGITKAQGEETYREFLSDIPKFEATLQKVITEWVHSCEHYLTNTAMNRIAWLGQASVCYSEGIPSVYRSGFFLLTQDEQDAANQSALTALNQWLEANDREPVTMDVAYPNRQSDIY